MHVFDTKHYIFKGFKKNQIIKGELLLVDQANQFSTATRSVNMFNGVKAKSPDLLT